MKILFITRKYPPSVGGMELFAYDLSNALAAKTDVRLIKWSGTGHVRAVLVALPYLFVKATGALLRGSIDVIHVQDGVLAPPAWLLAKLFRKPYTVVIHGLDMTYGSRFYQKTVPWFIRRADKVFCISQVTADEAKQGEVAAAKIAVIPLAITDSLYQSSSRSQLLKQLQLPSKAKILLTVGRLVKRKGVAWFIASVLPDLVKQHPEIIYLVVGEGEDRRNIEKAIQRSGLAEHVRLLGRASDELRAAAYNGAGVFVMPNINVPGDMEGFGLVLLEASACALPVVAADTEGIKDAVVDGKNGVLVPVEDTAVFQRAINRFLDNPAYAKHFGADSRRFTLSNYQWDTVAERYLQEFQRLVR